MSALYRYVYAVLFGCILSSTAFAQISDGLYKTLPDSLKPKNKTALTLREKQRILKGTLDVSSTAIEDELKAIVNTLEKEVNQTKDKRFKIETLYTLGAYYSLHSENTKAVAYYNQAIAEIGRSKDYNPTLAWCNTQLAAEYYGKSRNNEQSLEYLHKSFSVPGATKDSALISLNYNIYSVIYDALALYPRAIYYCEQAIKTSPARTRWTNNYTTYVLQEGITYSRFYGLTKKTIYADSAKYFIRQVMAAKKKEAEHWYAQCYYQLGALVRVEGKYAEGKMLLDSALLPIYNHSAYLFPNNFKRIYVTRALCQIRLGQIAQGKKTLDSLHITSLTTLREIYLALYEQAAGTHDYKAALDHFKQWKLVSDSINLVGQREKIVEIEQKYDVAQKQATIAKLENQNLSLENQNLLKEQENRNIIAVALLGVLLLAILTFLYSKRQQRIRQDERDSLTGNLRKLEDEMSLKTAREQAERAAAMIDQRKSISQDMHDEVSSSLVTLQYYVSDLRGQATHAETKEMLDKVEEEAHQVYIQARDFMHRLHNSEIQSQYNVIDFLKNLSTGFGEESSLTIYTEAEEAPIRQYFTPLHHTEMYLIIKEAVANSLKHSGANRMDITLTYRENAFHFSIADNGKGMPIQKKDGLGINSLTQRVGLLKGRLWYESFGTGTTLSGSFPAELVA